jgi:hypothetical protein
MGDRRPSHRSLHWWHLAALLVLVAAVEGGKYLIAGTPPQRVLGALPHWVYLWCPILAGVAISIRKADRETARAAVGVGIAVTLLMLALDLAGSLSPPAPDQTVAITERGYTSIGTDDTGTGWVRVLHEWLQGDLVGLEDRVPPGQVYPVTHPRRRAGEALLDGSLILLVFGILGLVLATGRWIRGHVTFNRPEDERAAHLVVAWLLSPMAVALTLRPADTLRFRALFEDGPLWAILLPSLVLLAVGIAAWVWSAKDPGPDESERPPDFEPTDDRRGE